MTEGLITAERPSPLLTRRFKIKAAVTFTDPQDALLTPRQMESNAVVASSKIKSGLHLGPTAK